MTDFGVQHLMAATKNSLSGLKIAYQNEQAFRHECAALVILAVVLLLCEKTPAEWCVVFGAWGLVMAVELLNSGIEKTCDLVTTEYRPLIKAAKDMASAAIFVALCVNVCVWIAVFVLGIRG